MTRDVMPDAAEVILAGSSISARRNDDGTITVEARREHEPYGLDDQFALETWAVHLWGPRWWGTAWENEGSYLSVTLSQK